MSSNVESNAANAQVVIVDQLIQYARKEYPADRELMEMLEDIQSAAKRLLGWLKFLQECQQRVKITYTHYIGVYFKEE